MTTTTEIPPFRTTFNAKAAAASRANRPIVVPELPAGAPAELTKALGELAELRANLRTTRAAVVELDGRPAELTAQRTDAQALSAALRSGKPDPGARAEQARLAALGDARRRSAGLQAAIGDVEAEIITMIEGNRDVWLAASEPAIVAARKAQEKAQLALDAAQAVLDQQQLFAQWLTEPRTRPNLPAGN